jgi:hypothetical protein
MPAIRHLALVPLLVIAVDSLLIYRGAFASDPGSATAEAHPADSIRIHEASLPVDAASKPDVDDAAETVQPAQYPPPAASGMSPAPAVTSGGPAAGKTTPPKKLPVQPWKLQFFDNDFGYKKVPDHQYLPGEELKDIPLDTFDVFNFLPEPTRLSAGGELRFRQMDEANRLRPGPPARGDYQLWRWRQYVDLKVDDWLRVYAEMIDASMDNNPLPVTGIDVNRWDALNLFIDVKIAEFGDRPIWFRGGRQELSYGSQRLVSALDWANTRRNFQGLKFFTKGSDWDFDLWFTRPVNTATPGDGPISQFASHFDSPNLNHTFSGAWFAYKAVKEQTIDMYWLWDWNSQFLAPNFTGGNRHTLASRWIRNFPVLDGDQINHTWHGDVEGGYQFGNDFGQNVSAGFVTAGAGHTWNQMPWAPNFWAYFDYASGSGNPGGGTTNTFAQQYGLTHAFFGQIDNIARQNIIDYNLKFTVKPLTQFTFQTQYHYFDLANSHDTLYTITGAPFGKPNRGTHVGEEIDLVGTYDFTPNFSLQIGYFWFWNGPVIQNNSPRGTGEQLYVQTTLRY